LFVIDSLEKFHRKGPSIKFLHVSNNIKYLKKLLTIAVLFIDLLDSDMKHQSVTRLLDASSLHPSHVI